MTYQISYANMSREEADKKAIEDAKFYAADTWPNLMYEMGLAEGIGTADAFQQLNIALGFVGIQGYPVHALARKYTLKAYRAWMASGDAPVQTDEKGFPIETETKEQVKE